MLTLDPSGQQANVRFVVAAEWIGLVSSRASRSETMHFVAGGVAHAFDSDLERVACGADPTGLEIVAVDFANDPFAYRCTACCQLIDAPRGSVTRRSAPCPGEADAQNG